MLILRLVPSERLEVRERTDLDPTIRRVNYHAPRPKTDSNIGKRNMLQTVGRQHTESKLLLRVLHASGKRVAGILTDWAARHARQFSAPCISINLEWTLPIDGGKFFKFSLLASQTGEKTGTPVFAADLCSRKLRHELYRHGA